MGNPFAAKVPVWTWYVKSWRRGTGSEMPLREVGIPNHMQKTFQLCQVVASIVCLLKAIPE
eukprot:3290284-Ditylum_brightwellii.AAC.1